MYRFTDPQRLAKALCDFLAFPVDEPTVDRLESTFWNAVEPLLAEDLAVRSLPDCVERLAATFESFLKKIAFLRYRGDALRWSGDGANYVGLVNTTLADLVRGLVGKTKAGVSAADLLAPIIDSRGTKGAIYGKAREVRNNVHRAQDYSLAETIALARTVLASYLLAVEDNSQLIEQTIYPQYRYLQKVVEAFRSWERQYIELEGQEEEFMADIGVLEPIAVECEFDLSSKGEEDDFEKSKQTSEDSDQTSELKPLNLRRRAPISKFVEEFQRLAVISGGGGGKTTTLQRLVLEQAQKLLLDPSVDLPIPVFIEANRYSRTFRFLDLVESELGISTDEVEKFLNDGKLTLFFDGLNEIAAPLQQEALIDLRNLLKKWPKPKVILSSRKSGYQNLFEIPTFELQELNDTQIERFLILSFADPQWGRKLFATLKNNSQLMEWARNPLLLRMLSKVAGSGDIPQNRGQMLMRFISWILSREKKTRSTNVETKKDVLSHLAFQMRKAGNVIVLKPVAIELIREKLIQLSPNVGANDLFQELVENRLLTRTERDEVRFFHELIQEFFAALELTRLFMLDANSVTKLMEDSRWEEPIILMAGFLPQKENLIKILCQNNLLLAAKSVASLRLEFPQLFEFVRHCAAECLERTCADIVRQTWTKTNIREVVGAVSVLCDETAIRLLCNKLPFFGVYYYDKVLNGLSFCEKTLLYRILLDPAIFEKLMANNSKREQLLELWFRIIEDISSTDDIEQAIKLCEGMPSTATLQVACAFDPAIALREINPFSLHLGTKGLKKLFSLVNAEKHCAFLREIISEEFNPLRFSAALKLATIKDATALHILIGQCLLGSASEQHLALNALATFERDQISSAIFDMLSKNEVSLEQLATSQLATHIEIDEKVLTAAPGFHSYFMGLLKSEKEECVRFALKQIARLSLGHLFRGHLIKIIRDNKELPIKMRMRLYEALKGQCLQGVIMLFDSSRQIGSIWCNETRQFYFLHGSEVWERDSVVIYDAVEFEVATGRKPKKDFDAIKITKLSQPVFRGVIDKVEPARRFGFVKTKKENSIFFHFDNVSSQENSKIVPGAHVSFVLVPRLKEPQHMQAVRVQLADCR